MEPIAGERSPSGGGCAKMQFLPDSQTHDDNCTM